MKKTKFISLARSLNKNEMHAFGKYLKRVHRNDEIAISVFDYVRKILPGIDAERKLDIDYAYKKVFSEPLNSNKSNRVRC